MLTSRLPTEERKRPATILSLQAPHDPTERSLFPAEHPILLRHAEAACRYGALIERAAARHGLLPSLIAALGSRQSGWGLNLSPAGPDGSADFTPRLHRTAERPGSRPPDGDGFARGLMQLDFDHHMIARSEAWRDPGSECRCRAQGGHRASKSPPAAILPAGPGPASGIACRLCLWVRFRAACPPPWPRCRQPHQGSELWPGCLGKG